MSFLLIKNKMDNISVLIIVVIIILLFTCTFLYVRAKLKVLEEQVLISKAFYLYGSSSEDESSLTILKTLYSSTKQYRKVFVIIDKQQSKEIRNTIVALVKDELSVSEDIIDFVIQLLSIRNPITVASLLVKTVKIKLALIKTINEVMNIVNKLKSDKEYLTSMFMKKTNLLYNLTNSLCSNSEIMDVLNNNDKDTLKTLNDNFKMLYKNKEHIREITSKLTPPITIKNLLEVMTNISEKH